MNHPYQVLGASVPRMLGRRRLIEQLERHILKPSPDHVQVVGPTLFGKSVFLNALAARHVSGDEQYTTAAYVDLRHAPPTDDTAFRRRFAEVVKAALSKAMPEIAEYLDLNDRGLHELLDLSFQEMEQKKARLLIVLDGFDHVLAGTRITRTLWDQLRSLAQKSSLRLVTGSRQPLRELCRTEESRTSDFWEIFYDTPIAVGPFAEDDWEEILAPLTSQGVSVDGSARKELINWSGGVPVLAAAILERLANEARNGHTLSKADVDRTAAEMLRQPPTHLQQLWEDCGVELRGDIASLADNEGLPLSDLSIQRQRALDGRGYGATSGNRMRSACRLMARYAVQQGPAVADLKRLFGTRKDFDGNVRGLLELRVAHLANANVDAELMNYVKSSVRDLEPIPDLALKWVRSIASRALAIIWTAELGADQKLPEAWIREWQGGGERLQWMDPGQRLPRRQGAQCNVLRLATGADNIRPLARFVTKPTALLVDALQSIGDFGQHREDFPESSVSIGYAAGVVTMAIELVDGLSRDLARGTGGG